jgi:hypothetical protein
MPRKRKKKKNAGGGEDVAGERHSREEYVEQIYIFLSELYQQL